MSEKPISLNNIPAVADDWDHYFLSIAVVAAIKSKDPRCQVGAVIASEDRVILSTGFNGLARGVDDAGQLLADVPEKLKMICHAEMNAIVNAARIGVSLEDATIYVTKFPCLACCNAIIQAGVRRVYTHDKWFWNDDPADQEHIRKPVLLQQAGVKVDAPFHPSYSIPARLAQDAAKAEAAIERKPPARSGETTVRESAIPIDRPTGTDPI